MYKLIIATLLSCLFCNVYAGEPTTTEIRVALETETVLSPFYLAQFTTDESSYTKYYAAEIRKVLEFDLNHNGSSYVLPMQEDKEKVLQNSNKQAAFQSDTWKNTSIHQIVCGSISGKKLSLTMYAPKTHTLKTLAEIHLSGNLSHDRKQIHKAADTIHKNVFNSEGVCSNRILFALKKNGSQKNWTSEIWECDWDGANKRQITKEGSYGVTPVMIPSSSGQSDKFLYVSYKLGQPKIFLASLQKGEGKRLIDLRGNQLLPAISSKKDLIAFICDASGRADLFIQNFDPQKGAIGKPVQLFSYPRSVQASPTFSPSGDKIAFVSDKDGSARIYVIPVKVGGKRADPLLITKANKESSCPSWSPDGKKIAYSAKTNGIRQIWIYDFDTQSEWQLTSGPGNKENPVWAPNSLHLVFNSVEGSVSDLYVVNLHQSEPVKITNGEGKNHYPTWGTK